MGDQSLRGREVIIRKKGEFFFSQNDGSRQLYVVKKGKARVFKTEGEIEVDLDMVGSGGIFGEIAAIDGGKRSASVVAVEDTEAYCIDQGEFQKIVGEIPDWFQKIATILVHRLREVDDKIERVACGDWTPSVAAALTLFFCARRCDTIDLAATLNLKYVENELMDILGMKLADVTAALQGLERLKLVSIEKGKIAPCNAKKLAALGQTLFTPPAESPVV